MPEQEETEFNGQYGAYGDHPPGIEDVLGTALNDSKTWFDAQVAYSKLSGSEALGKLFGDLVLGFVVALCITGGLLLCSIALAIWLGQIMNSLALGFLSSAGIFIVMAALVYFLFGPAIRNFITLSIINTIHEKD